MHLDEKTFEDQTHARGILHGTLQGICAAQYLAQTKKLPKKRFLKTVKSNAFKKDQT
jgi:hypothetical protein